MRTFTDEEATLGKLPLMIGVTGYAGSGKTLSALRLAAGVQRVHGGDVWCIDTENRAQEYAEQVKFRRVSMAAPYSPDDYLAAVKHIRGKGGRVIVIDSMSDEHDGPGGVLDMHFQYMQANNNKQSMNQPGWAQVKGVRKRWEGYARVLRDHEDVIFVPCWRAKLAYKPKTKDEKVREQVEGGRPEPTDHQWDVSTTSDMPYLCSVRFLLYPGADGFPLLRPTTSDEKMLVKTSLAYDAYVQTIKQLNEDVGQRLAEIASGKAAQEKPMRAPTTAKFHPEFGEASGLVSAAPRDKRQNYLCWLDERMQAAQGDDRERIGKHADAVQRIAEEAGDYTKD